MYSIVVFVVMCVAQVYISSGRDVKSVVSDAQLAMVLDNIKPALKHKRCVLWHIATATAAAAAAVEKHKQYQQRFAGVRSAVTCCAATQA
jgi:hypothetical protein